MCSLLFLALVHRHMFADHYPKPCPVPSCGSARPPATGRNGPWASVRSSDSATWETDFGQNKMGLLCVKWCKYVIVCVNRYPHKIPQVTIPLNGEFQADFGDLDGYTTYLGMSGWTDSQTWMFHTYQTCEVKSQTCGSKMINAVTYEGVSWSSQKNWWGYSFSYVPLFRRFLLIGVALPWIMEGHFKATREPWTKCNTAGTRAIGGLTSHGYHSRAVTKLGWFGAWIWWKHPMSGQMSLWRSDPAIWDGQIPGIIPTTTNSTTQLPLAMWAFWRRRDLVAGLQSLRMKIYEDGCVASNDVFLFPRWKEMVGGWKGSISH